MGAESIKRRAEAYIASEKVRWFREDVEKALASNDLDGLNDRFYTELEFGTAGLRGIIGGGLNRMNPYIVRRVTQGLADYLRRVQSGSAAGETASVVIAYDSRNFSDVFAQTAAEVLCGNGVKVELFSTLHPVPMLSYTVMDRGATAGIVITASHNPAEYNGYKVYWSDGAQVTPPHDIGIAECVQLVKDASSIRSIPLSEAIESGSARWLTEERDESYYAIVLSHLHNRHLFPTYQNKEEPAAEPCRVFYTPLHGSGNVPVQTLMRRLGVDFYVVPEQEAPNGSFPTVKMPNPEDPEAMTLAVNLGKAVHADIVLGTDPDSDRLGIAVPNDHAKSSFTLLNGNQIAALLCDYLLTVTAENGKVAPSTICVKSLVTTDLMRYIAESRGAACEDVLTGFKYIAEVIERASHEDQSFLFGAEESYGYLALQEVRDKDAVSTALFAVEMMLYHASAGKSILERLEELWIEHGYFEERVISKSYKGESGRAAMQGIMRDYRETPPTRIAGLAVIEHLDLLPGGVMGLPSSNVIILRLEGGSKVIVRPSGTEPKIKFYIFARAKESTLSASKDQSAEIIKRIVKDLGL